MRSFAPHPLVLVALGLAAAVSGRALAQSDTDAGGAAEPPAASDQAVPDAADEEITVRGRRPLSEYRQAVEDARQELIEVFNEENRRDSTDVTCRNERPTGTRMPRRVCRTRAQNEADARAASDFLNSLLMSSGGYRDAAAPLPPPGGPQVNALIGTSGSQAAGVIDNARARAELDEELKQLQRENRRLYRAAMKYLEAEEEYRRAREQAER